MKKKQTKFDIDKEKIIKHSGIINKNIQIAIDNINEAAFNNKKSLEQIKSNLYIALENYRKITINSHMFYTLEEKIDQIKDEFPVITIIDEKDIIIVEKKIT